MPKINDLAWSADIAGYWQDFMYAHWSPEETKEIELIAYFLWQDAGCPDGQSERFWSEAELKYSHPELYVDIKAIYDEFSRSECNSESRSGSDGQDY